MIYALAKDQNTLELRKKRYGIVIDIRSSFQGTNYHYKNLKFLQPPNVNALNWTSRLNAGPAKAIFPTTLMLDCCELLVLVICKFSLPHLNEPDLCQFEL